MFNINKIHPQGLQDLEVYLFCVGAVLKQTKKPVINLMTEKKRKETTNKSISNQKPIMLRVNQKYHETSINKSLEKQKL